MRTTPAFLSVLLLFSLAGCREESDVSASGGAPHHDAVPHSHEGMPSGEHPPMQSPLPPEGQPRPVFPGELADGTPRPPLGAVGEAVGRAADGAWGSLQKGLEQADRKLVELRTQLEPKLDEASAATRAQWEKLEAQLEESRADAARKLAELRDASGDRLDEARQAYQQAYERLQRQLNDAPEKLKSGGVR